MPDPTVSRWRRAVWWTDRYGDLLAIGVAALLMAIALWGAI
jgi:hypothetical protein